MTGTVFVNGRLWRWKSEDAYAHEYAEWMRVAEDGTIQAIGSGSPPTALENETVVDLKGNVVLPGLHDSHIHAYGMGESAEYLNLFQCTSFEEFGERLKAYDRAFPDKAWIIGFGWEQDTLSESARYPSRHDIDAVVRDRPVLLHRACWHIAVANTKALEIAGINAQQMEWDLASGSVDVDANGVTGILREAAVELVGQHTAESSDEIRLKYLRSSLQRCVSNGLTAIHTNDVNAWDLYKRLEANGELPLRAYLTVPISELKKPTTPVANTRIGLLSCDRIKIFSDGSLGAETAALRHPYRGTENKGILMDTDDVLIQKVRDANEAGFRLEIHAIGDRAAEQVLMALREANVPKEKRPILTHCQILGKDLIQQMADQGVIGNIQPSFTITDAAFARKRLPEHMIPYSYCWKTMMQQGVVCAGGSDAPIETCNPFQGMYDAIYRHKPNQPQDAYLPEECLSLDEAMYIYTKNGAYACMEEQRLGDLRVGFQADFVVLSADVEQDPTSLLSSTLVHSVWVNGNKTYDRVETEQKAVEMPDFSQSLLPGKNGPMRICSCCRH